MAGLYPTIESIFNATRVIINDAFAGATSTQGEGRVFIDTWPPTITHLNLAIDQFKRDLENSGVTTNRTETFYTSLPAINGPLGSGVPDPSVQLYLGFAGYWDGSSVLASPTLPSDLVAPLEVWTRISGTGLTYGKIDPAPDGLPSIYQDYTIGNYEWRGDKIYFNGSVVQQDMRLRYEAGLTPILTTLSPTLFPTTTVGFLEATQPLALYTAYVFIKSKNPAAAPGILADYTQATAKIANRYVKMKQRTPHERQAFGEGDTNYFGWFG